MSTVRLANPDFLDATFNVEYSQYRLFLKEGKEAPILNEEEIKSLFLNALPEKITECAKKGEGSLVPMLAGLTSSELNKLFLSFLDAVDGIEDANNVLYFHITVKPHHKNGSQPYIFSNLFDFQLFLEKYNNLVVPQEVSVDEVKVETIKKAHRELLKITEVFRNSLNLKVLEKSTGVVARKAEIIQGLKNALDDMTKPKYERLKDFSKILLSPEAAVLDQHHDQRWGRFVRQALNILSFLFLVPAAARAIHDRYVYGTAQFWKPRTEKLKSLALYECAQVKLGA